MSIFARIAKSLSSVFGSTTSSPSPWFLDWYRGNENDSGVPINGKTALQYAPLWYAVNKICGHVGQLPLPLYVRDEKDDRKRTEAWRHPAYALTMRRPNDFMAPNVFKETIQAHALLWGNGRAAIVRNMRNDPVELIPLLPDRTVTVLMNDEKWHVVTDSETGEKTRIHDDDVLHIPGLGFDGIQGYSLIEMAKNSIGLGLASEKHANRHFKHNAVPSMILEAPPGVFKKEEDAKTFLMNWNKWHQGVDNSNKTGLLREGIKANTLGMKGTDAQWIEQRKFQRVEAALWTALEQILGDDSSVSYNSLEQKNLAYLTTCLMRWLVKIEEEGNRKLLTGLQFRTGSHYFKFKVNALLRGTIKERYDVYALARANGILNPNECRAMEELPPREDEGGESYDNPNTTPGVSPAKPEPTDAAPTEKEPAIDKEQMLAMVRTFAESLQPPAVNVTVPEQAAPVVSVTLPESQVTVNLPEHPTPVVNVTPPAVTVEVTGPSAAVHQQLVANRIREIIAVESKRAIEAAGKQKNFVAWLDGFYAESDFVPRLRAVWRQCGGRPEQADAYAEESKALLLDVAGAANQEQLASAVESATSLWIERADMQAELILTQPERKESSDEC